jgi:S1-C subfamily serine protease
MKYTSPNKVSVLPVFVILLIAFLQLEVAVEAASFDEIDQRVVCINTISDNGKSKIGSGFFISDSLIATVYHQVRNGRSIVYKNDGTKTEAVVVVSDPRVDLAVIEVPKSDSGYINLSRDDSRLSMGQDIFTIGCPLGFDHSLSRGIVSYAKRKVNGLNLIQIDMTVNHGNSGGPLLNKEGRVIGIVWGKLKDSTNINFAIPTIELKKLLNTNEKAENDGVLSAELSALWEQATSSNDLHEQKRLYQKILLKDPDLAEVHYNMGLVLFSLGEYHNAKNRFKDAIKLKPDYYKAYSNLGLVLGKLKKYKKARDALIKSISIK